MLTSSQAAAFKADVQSSEFSGLPPGGDSAFTIAAAYNLNASPAFWVWRTLVTRKEAVSAVSTDEDGTTTRSFIWAGNGYITRAQGERDAFVALFNHEDTINPSLDNVRAAFADIFSGTGNAASNRQHLSNVGRRIVTRCERLFVTGTGTAATPGKLTYEGNLTPTDVQNAMGW
jgi:hypothetical protein